MNYKAFLNTRSSKARALPIVILYVTESCNLKCITCSYRNALPGELTLDEIKNLSAQLHTLGLRHIVYSGGEPLLRRDFPAICDVFAKLNVKQSLLTNGLLLEKRINEIHKYFHEIIVSIDGADAETHNSIRGVNSFDQILKGVNSALALSPKANVSIRTVVQKSNYRQLPDIVKLAKSIAVSRISFLSADVEPGAFGRTNSGNGFHAGNVLLDENELTEFKEILNKMFIEHKSDFESKFISESPDKMLHLADYFEAHLGRTGFPVNICNAPMVSAVITSTGDILPCYFLPSYGNIRKSPINELINCDSIRQTRTQVKNLTQERCKTCVCSLYVNSRAALSGRF